MKMFRMKLAAILLLAEQNERKGCPFVPQADDGDTGSPDDCMEIEKPQNPKKRKLGEGELSSSQTVSTKILPTQQVANNSGGDNQSEMLFWFQSMCDLPMSKDDLTALLCDYIVSIDDAGQME